MIEALFNPKSIAVIGASRNRNKVGNIALRNIISTFKGKIYPINDKAPEVEGLKTYKSIKNINDKVDLAIIAIPRDYVPGVMEELGEAGVSAAIILTAGFRELDEKGAKLENEIKQTARKYGIRFLGPNTFGLLTPDFNATFSPFDVKRGNIAVLSQSGGLGFYVLDWLQRYASGVSYFVSLGNQADINEVDALEYIVKDKRNKAIFAYIEGVSEGRKLLDLLYEVTDKIPVVFLKGGISSGGAKAAKTHTGSLAGSYDVFKAAITSAGGIVVERLEDFLELMKLYSFNEPVKDKILIITNSGGHGVLTSDAVEKYGLSLYQLDDSIREKLKAVLPSYLSPNNPLDLSVEAPSSVYDMALDATKDLNCTKIVIGEYSPVTSCVEDAKVIMKYKGKSVIGVFMGVDEREAIELLTKNGIPAFNYPETAIRIISYLFKERKRFKKPDTRKPSIDIEKFVEGKEYLRDYEAFRLLELYNIPVTKYKVVYNENDVNRYFKELNPPIVMKISTDTPIHKSDIGGVRLDIRSEMEALEAYKKLSKLSTRVLMQEQVRGDEVFIGGITDPVFGPTIIVGIGGTLVEVLNKVTYGIAPISYQEADYLLKESGLDKILTVRGKNYDIQSLTDVIVKSSELLAQLKIKEMDLNPVIVNERGALVVDSRILLKK